VVEFAIAVPFLLTLTLGIIDLSQGSARKFALEQAAQRTIELVAVGDQRQDYQHLRAMAATHAGVSATDVTVDQWLECNGARQPSFTGSCVQGQTIARYVSVVINGSYRPSFPAGPLGSFVGVRSDGTIALQGDAGVRVQ
jgi:hypothetical protein